VANILLTSVVFIENMKKERFPPFIWRWVRRGKNTLDPWRYHWLGYCANLIWRKGRQKIWVRASFGLKRPMVSLGRSIWHWTRNTGFPRKEVKHDAYMEPD
jgi:hypothetical protein